MARSAAALFSIATYFVALRNMPGEEYARASIAVAAAAVVLPVLFQPFAKYVLFSGEWKRVARVFWWGQPTLCLLIACVVCIATLLIERGTGLMACAALFAVTQGWKEFCGEMARSKGDLAMMQRLYIFDAIVTCVAVALLTMQWPRAEIFLLASALSSALFSLVLTPFHEIRGTGGRYIVDVVQIYRYSFGLSVGSFLNAGTFAIARVAIRGASPVELVGSIQFILDMAQKTVALLASSLTSALVPEARNNLRKSVLVLSWVLGGALVVITVSACIAVEVARFWDDAALELRYPVIAGCAYFVWSLKYKTAALDLPLVSSEQFAPFVVIGSLVAFLLMNFLLPDVRNLSKVLIYASSIVVLGGVISVLVAVVRGLVRISCGVHMLGIPVVAGLVIYVMGTGL